MNLNHALTRLEKRLQRLVEDSLDGIFTATDLQKKLSLELLLALQREARPTSDGRIFAPDQFTIFLTPETTWRFTTTPSRTDELAQVLAEAIEDFAHQAGYQFNDKLSVRILTEQPAENFSAGKPSIVASFKLQDTTQTATLGVGARVDQNLSDESKEPGKPHTKTTAFLIVNGVDVFILPDLSIGGVINIGRMSSNQLVINDGRVSRTHAQLRIMQGRYMLFDLASTYGTFVNGLRVNTHVLRPGDVISFGGVPVVFGLEDNPDQEQQNHHPGQPTDL